jgi:uncharacterized repeat protein (TIGR03803 family)
MTFLNRPTVTRLVVLASLFLSMLTNLQAQSEKTIFVFNGTTQGANPGGALVADSSGALYGTTMAGGSASLGTVFKLSPPAVKGGAWTETILHNFQGGLSDGEKPWYVTPVLDRQGNLYGTTSAGGANYQGTLFQLVPPSEPDGAWTQNILYSFGSLVGVILDGADTIFGTTNSEVYELSSSAGTWNYSTIYDGVDGFIVSNLTLSKGVLYGAFTQDDYGYGSVFTLQKAAKGEWTPETIWGFRGGPGDGSNPESTITVASGVAYGTTTYAGSAGYGTVYSLTPPASPGDPWTETILYNFTGGSDGGYPMGGVTFGSGGELYGTTSTGGAGKLGTIFKLTPPKVTGDPWQFTLLHSFSGKNGDYGQPVNTLLLNHGIFYGTTPGGANNAGTIFELTQ